VFNERYKTIGKLGYGSASTVWLCRDLRKQNEFAALKVYINCSKVHRELPIYEHINSLSSEHQGRDHVRKLLEAFNVEGPHGTHICLVHQPLGISLDEARRKAPGGVLPAALVREAYRWILRGLEFLHQEAHVIHTGELKHRNTTSTCCSPRTRSSTQQYVARHSG
jgi:serine/threonine-protein kinase SRPK3